MTSRRGRGKMTWVKIHVSGILTGSMNYQLTLEEQMIFVKLIAFSASCGVTPGKLCDNDERPIPRSFLKDICHAPEEVFESSVQKCLDEGRLVELDGCLEIAHWKQYQSEYQRQKPYRDNKEQMQFGEEEQINNCIAYIKTALKEESVSIEPIAINNAVREHFSDNGTATAEDSVKAVINKIKEKILNDEKGK